MQFKSKTTLPLGKLALGAAATSLLGLLALNASAAAVDVAACKAMAEVEANAAAAEARAEYKAENCSKIKRCGIVFDGGKCAKERDKKVKACNEKNRSGANKVAKAAYDKERNPTYEKCIKDSGKASG